MSRRQYDPHVNQRRAPQEALSGSRDRLVRAEPLPRNLWEFLAWTLQRPGRMAGFVALVAIAIALWTWEPSISVLMKYLH